MIFPRRKRITAKADFKQIFRGGKKINRAAFMLVILHNLENEARLGFAVSRKYTRSAVHRNQIKRIVKESFRRQTLLKSIDILFVAKADIKNWDKQQLSTSLEQLWQELI